MRRSAHGRATGRVRQLLARAVIVVPLGLAGCQTDRPPAVTSVDLFVPHSMRIHPIFTQVADLDGSGKPDGIEAQLEFDDQFGDPTKASGQVLFELYESRRQPPYTGKRLAVPFVASLATVADQRERWNKTLRTYRFPLSYPALNPAQDYVITATFELTGGGRFFDKRLIAGHHPPGKSDGENSHGPLGL